MRHHAPHTPFILVGLKSDIRNDKDTLYALKQKGIDMVTTEQITKLGKELGASHTFECSALTQDGLKQVFDAAVRIGMEPKKKDNKKKCVIL